MKYINLAQQLLISWITLLGIFSLLITVVLVEYFIMFVHHENSELVLVIKRALAVVVGDV